MWLVVVACIQQTQREIRDQLLYDLNHDALTQALSRTAFFRCGDTLLTNSECSGQPLVLMMLDIDHFKQVNNRYGHIVGDLALRHFAAIVQQEIRQHDVFGRLGGEEFALMLNPVGYEDALHCAECLRQAIIEQPLMLATGQSLTLSVSIGMIYYGRAPQHPLRTMLIMVDEVLYEAKHAGRNRVVAISLG